MPSNKSKRRFSKNRLNLDMAISKRSVSVYWAGYVALVMLMAWLARLSWYGMALVLVLSCLLSLVMASRPKVRHLSCQKIDELWDIGVQKGQTQMLWQGYLSDIKMLNILDKAIFLRLYVIEPKRRTLGVLIHRRDVNDADFRKLLGLAAIRS